MVEAVYGHEDNHPWKGNHLPYDFVTNYNLTYGGNEWLYTSCFYYHLQCVLLTHISPCFMKVAICMVILQ